MGKYIHWPNTFLPEIGKDFIHLLFPDECKACGGVLVKGEKLLCTHCLLEIPRIPIIPGHETMLYRRLLPRIAIKEALSFLSFTKGSKTQQILHVLKYGNCPELGLMLGILFAEDLINSNYPLLSRLIIPVPLHPSRLKKRGYNQSHEFGKGISERLRIPVLEALKRKVQTETQTNRNRLNRWENVKGIFSLEKPDLIIGKDILLVDDVVTTGATIESCCETLQQAGCGNISIACIATA